MSIRHLDLTPNTSESSFRLTPNSQLKKQSKDSIDSGCQNEAIQSNCENDRNGCYCDLNTYNNNRDVRKKDTLDLTVNNRKSSSSTLSDASSCGTNNDRIKRESQKYHSIARNRQRKDALVARSKSFQEQDIKLPSNARFNILRRQNRTKNNFDQQMIDEIISHHNIEITIEDMDADQPNKQTRINNDRAPNRESSKFVQNECSSVNSSELNYDRGKIRSGHILGRIFRRMRKLSMTWRKSKNKSKTRGEQNEKFKAIPFSLHNNHKSN